jgi:medium-chain acyl-[acyl-carrier-protein] hydrolase
MSVGMEPLRQTFTIHTYEVDPFRELSVAALAGYMQEAAWVHARGLGYGIESFMRRGLTWVLVRQQLQRSRPVWLGESVEVKTWPSGRERMALLRDFEIRDGRGEVIARAVSHWFILDLDKRRPVAPESVVAPAILEGNEHVLPLAREKLPAVEAWQREVRLPVRYPDIDMNLHANHASYLDWALETLPEAKWRGERLVASDVQYLAEARRGDLVLSRLAPAGEAGVFHHALVRAEDGKELARAQTQWAPREGHVGLVSP